MGGRYRLGAALGRGGMGEVYRAFDVAKARPVALKRFHLEGERETDRLRFRREFHVLAQLSHPRIVEAYDFGIDELGQPYYTMELLDGRDLGRLAPMPWREACPLLRDVASGLAFLHARQLLHRDIAPRNVRCTSDGRAKLIDFGMMATVGISSEIVGTLPSIAPEMILGLPTDGRADLFGLGALAFWLLTGEHPQRVRSLDDLIRNGRKPPPPPSRIVADLPPDLDDLVLSLLSPDPLGRPNVAGVVIDRLTAIADLKPAPLVEHARGYVQSAGLVGRTREIRLLKERVDRCVDGVGSAVLIEGHAGMGKTRLMRELELEAKLAGALVLRGQGRDAGPYALIRSLARKLESAIRGGMLGSGASATFSADRLLPSGGGLRTSMHISLDHREERLALQSALSDFIGQFAKKRPLVMIVDNIHHADEGSAAVLAGLAHVASTCGLLIVGAVRTGDSVRASGAIDNIRERALVLRTQGLDASDVGTLVEGMFGHNTTNVPALATWLHKATDGSPMMCIELVRHLIERGEIRYVSGTWSLPTIVRHEQLPQRLAQALDSRVAALPPAALQLGQAVAVLSHAAPLAFCILLVPEISEDDVFAAIDGLVEGQLLLGSSESYRLVHHGVAEALLRTLSAAERQRLELAIGQLLQAKYPESDDHVARIGWHLLRGGERTQGAEQLAQAGEMLFDATSFEDCVAPLEAALEVFEAERIEPARVAEIYYMLVAAGFSVDRNVAVRHQARALVVLGEQSAATRARRWSRFLGNRLGFGAALAVTTVARWLRGASRRGLPPLQALDHYLRSCLYWAGVAGFSFDTKALSTCVGALTPLRAIEQPQVRNAIGLVDNLLSFNLGRLRTVMETSQRTMDSLKSARFTSAEQALSLGGFLFQRALVAVRTGAPDALDEIRALEELGPRIWAIGALQLRTYYHLWRGESADAEEVWSEAELEFVRLGALWQLYAIHPSSACVPGAMVGDALGLKRYIEGLERQIAAGLQFQQHRHIAQAEYELLGGRHAAARTALEPVWAQLPADEGLVRPWALSVAAECSLAAGEYDRAEADGEEALRVAASAEQGSRPFEFRCRRIIAMAYSERGEHGEAATRLLALIEDATLSGNPFFIGYCHEAAAKVAFACDDTKSVELHCAAVSKAFHPTRNPVLVARSQRLARQCGLGPAPAATVRSDSALPTEVPVPHQQTDEAAQGVDSVLANLSVCRTPVARAEAALRALLEARGSEAGYLYLLRGGEARLVAPTHGAEPPSEVVQALRAVLAVDGPDGPTLRRDTKAAWVPAVLRARRGGGVVVVGALIAKQGGRSDSAEDVPQRRLRDAIGQRLYDEGDVTVSPPATDD